MLWCSGHQGSPDSGLRSTADVDEKNKAAEAAAQAASVPSRSFRGRLLELANEHEHLECEYLSLVRRCKNAAPLERQALQSQDCGNIQTTRSSVSAGSTSNVEDHVPVEMAVPFSPTRPVPQPSQLRSRHTADPGNNICQRQSQLGSRHAADDTSPFAGKSSKASTEWSFIDSTPEQTEPQSSSRKVMVNDWVTSSVLPSDVGENEAKTFFASMGVLVPNRPKQISQHLEATMVVSVSGQSRPTTHSSRKPPSTSSQSDMKKLRHSQGSLKAKREASASRITSGSNTDKFDPTGSLLKGFWRERSGDTDLEGAQVEVLINNSGQQADPFVLLPAGQFRIMWDVGVFICLFFELWMTPFELVFIKDMPQYFVVVSQVITGFFGVDIALNFNTGYFKRDRTIMSRRAIVKNYLSRWFWIDLISTIPFDIILSSNTGVLRWMRFGKATRFLKALRYLKLARSVRLIASVKKSNWGQSWALRLRRISGPVEVFMFLAVFAHIHGCLDAFLQPGWSSEREFRAGFVQYAKSFRWAYVALITGDISRDVTLVPDTNALGPWMLDVIMSSERLCFYCLLGFWVVVTSQTRYSERARLIKLKDDALHYLKWHQVSFETQVQVLFILHETGKARNRQKHFRDLMDNELPLELKRKICAELWSERLMSLGLISIISVLDDGFLLELSLLVREEVFASKAVIFRYGETAIACYYVIDGLLDATSVEEKQVIPPFLQGNWIGVMALVNSFLRRSMTVVTQQMTSLMVVPADSFQGLLKHRELIEGFQQMCATYLWRGLCGRCGVLGDHFDEHCPTIGGAGPAMEVEIEDTVGTQSSPVRCGTMESRMSMPQMMVATKSDAMSLHNPAKPIQRDLHQFLRQKKLARLIPVLVNLGVKTLEDLQALDIAEINEELDMEQALTSEEEQCISNHSINAFKESAAQAVRRHVFKENQTTDHFIFLSHSKVEGGTEAALMREELAQLISEDTHSHARTFDTPVFLDSENLSSLKDLQAIVEKCHNLAVLLTEKVLERPWVLVEIVCAVKAGLQLIPVLVHKPGNVFKFPDEKFYSDISSDKFLSADGVQVLKEADIDLTEVERCLRELFNHIAIPYSPHRSAEMRKAELASLLKRCSLRSDGMKLPVARLATVQNHAVDMRAPGAGNSPQKVRHCNRH